MSEAEETLAAQLSQAGIPFQREFMFARSIGRRWRADFWIGDMFSGRPIMRPLLVEIDGGGYIAGRHSRGRGMELDAEKQSAAAILGYRVIRATPLQVENGTALSWIQSALGLPQERQAS